MSHEGQGLLLTSCMAPIADQVVAAVAAYLQQRLETSVHLVNDISWQAREQAFDRGDIDICWLCGLPYVWKADRAQSDVELLAAPVMRGERYAGRPVYFSDVVVRRDSSFQSFDDLRGARWAYNETRSHSGYFLTRSRLADMNLDGSYFGRIVAAGSHQRALEMILRGEIDASAIDSTVLAMVLQQKPEIGDCIRVVDSWGPSPMPPWLASKQMPQTLRQSVRDELLQMDRSEEGRAILQQGLMLRFAAVNDEDYDAIRRMAQKASTVALVATEETAGAEEIAPGATV